MTSSTGPILRFSLRSEAMEPARKGHTGWISETPYIGCVNPEPDLEDQDMGTIQGGNHMAANHTPASQRSAIAKYDGPADAPLDQSLGMLHPQPQRLLTVHDRVSRVVEALDEGTASAPNKALSNERRVSPTQPEDQMTGDVYMGDHREESLAVERVASTANSASEGIEMSQEVVLAEVSHTNSMTWLSKHERECQRWARIWPNMQRLAPLSGFPPTTFAQWIDHQNCFVGLTIDRMEAKLASRELRLDRLRLGIPRIRPAFRGKRFDDGKGAVLCCDTIWTLTIPSSANGDRTPRKHTAGWPCQQELKWEGDDRAKTSVRRFPPLPRVPGNKTVAWHHLQLVLPSDFDEVRRLSDLFEAPDWEEIKLNDRSEKSMIGVDLWNALS